ncbi:MAG: hypothetical protein QM808_09880 [Steroidobacteraceae bacterium]
MNRPTDDVSAKAAGATPLEQRSREIFDQQVAGQDARTRSRLNQARQAALEVARAQAGHGHSPLRARWMVPVGSAAALALVALTATQLLRPAVEQPVIEAGSTPAVDDLEIIASSDELEMLQNVDFYAWLETQQDSEVDDVNGAGESG